MSEPTGKRRYNKISPEHLKYAKGRFAEFASTSTVRAELSVLGTPYPYNALYYYWKLANKGFGGALAAASDADDGDAA